MASNPNADLDKLITFGQMALEQGWYDQAREYFEQVLALDVSDREAIKGLARVNEILSRRMATPVEPTRAEPVESPRKVSFEPAEPEVEPAKPGVERGQQASFEPHVSADCRKQARTVQRGVRYWTVRVVLVAVAFGVLIGLMAIWWTVSTPLGSSTVTRGSGGRVGQESEIYRADEFYGVWIAIDEQAYSEHQEALRAHDDIGVFNLEMQGRVFTVMKGTKVLVLDRRSGRTKVRILEGDYFGFSGWVVSKFVK